MPAPDWPVERHPATFVTIDGPHRRKPFRVLRIVALVGVAFITYGLYLAAHRWSH